MALPNLTIRRICLHEVQKRNEDKQPLPVTYAPGLLNLEGRAMAAFASRVHSAYRSDAQCMEMAIANHAQGSVAQLGTALVASNDVDFVQQSRAFADLLNQHQHSRSIPGGLVVVFDGTAGNPATPFFAVMKAEMHEGFLRGANLTAEFVDSLFLSPKNKLYKIGLFHAKSEPAGAMPSEWTAILYDKQMTAANRDGAASYFHGSFLGLAIPENSAQKVKTFFDKTQEFIRESNITQEQKTDLYNGLFTYLKVDQSPNIQVGTFAERFMTEELGEGYRAHMRRARFPTEAIAKDISEISGRLRLRRFRFPSSIVLSGPPEAISDLVTVKAVEGENGENWTVITVRAPLEAQE